MKKLIQIIVLCISFKVSALHVNGRVDRKLNSHKDSIYVALVWHSGDTQPHSVDKSIGSIVNGSFNFIINDPPPIISVLKAENFEFSVAYIIIFKDINGDKKYDVKKDEFKGVSESNCITFIKGNINKFLDQVEKNKKSKIKNLRKLNEGLNIASVVKRKNEFFDDLETVNNKYIIINYGKKDDVNFPNWT